TTFANVEIYFDQNRFAMFISMIGALLNIGLNYVFIRLFGYIAAAYTTLFCYIVFAASHYIYMTRSVKRIIGQHMFNTARLVGLSVAILLAGIGVVFMYDKIVEHSSE
ncbi:MAG: polysaccharide biosynthesis C-terminal domain-containing protein, partial [Blautia sp.]|nr:polysaccharide biosynthesis C-terminal domain-containing protein [Blautia sp.]